MYENIFSSVSTKFMLQGCQHKMTFLLIFSATLFEPNQEKQTNQSSELLLPNFAHITKHSDRTHVETIALDPPKTRLN